MGTGLALKLDLSRVIHKRKSYKIRFWISKSYGPSRRDFAVAGGFSSARKPALNYFTWIFFPFESIFGTGVPPGVPVGAGVMSGVCALPEVPVAVADLSPEPVVLPEAVSSSIEAEDAASMERSAATGADESLESLVRLQALRVAAERMTAAE